jgi:hypothetical protein
MFWKKRLGDEGTAGIARVSGRKKTEKEPQGLVE